MPRPGAVEAWSAGAGVRHLLPGRAGGRAAPTHALVPNLLLLCRLLLQEDDLLRRLIGDYGAKNWSIIAAGIKGRSGKSCRLRCVGAEANQRPQHTAWVPL